MDFSSACLIASDASSKGRGQLMAFEVFEKGSAPLPTVPAVTIQKRGLMSINRAAFALIGSPNAVELLWDKERRIIGIRGAEATNPNAYPARPQTASSNRGPMLVAGNLFTRYIELDTSVAKRWTPTIEDGVLCIDLKTPGQKVLSNRQRAAKAESDE